MTVSVDTLILLLRKVVALEAEPPKSNAIKAMAAGAKLRREMEKIPWDKISTPSDLLALLEAAQEPRWRPLKTAPFGEYCRVWARAGYHTIAMQRSDRTWRLKHGTTIDVTHWYPLCPAGAP